jgi:hypothetical protein
VTGVNLEQNHKLFIRNLPRSENRTEDFIEVSCWGKQPCGNYSFTKLSDTLVTFIFPPGKERFVELFVTLDKYQTTSPTLEAVEGGIATLDVWSSHLVEQSACEKGMFVSVLDPTQGCTLCPAGGDCGTGGSRLLPQKGYWNPNDFSGFVRGCPPPSEDRCIGRRLCSAPYKGPYCATCNDGFYKLGEYCLQCTEEARERAAAANTALVIILNIAMFAAPQYLIESIVKTFTSVGALVGSIGSFDNGAASLEESVRL